METRRIGSLTVSVIGLGCNNFGRRLDANASASVVHAALDAGVTSSIRQSYTVARGLRSCRSSRLRMVC